MRSSFPQPTADVLRYTADVCNFIEWGTGVLSVAQDRGDEPGLNATYAVRRRLGRRVFEVRITIADLQPDSSIVMHGVSNRMPWTSEMTFTPVDAGTRVSESIDLQPTGIARIFSLVLALLVRRTHRQDLENLRRRLDRNA